MVMTIAHDSAVALVRVLGAKLGCALQLVRPAMAENRRSVPVTRFLGKLAICDPRAYKWLALQLREV
jgi:hypothetical protein